MNVNYAGILGENRKVVYLRAAFPMVSEKGNVATLQLMGAYMRQSISEGNLTAGSPRVNTCLVIRAVLFFIQIQVIMVKRS